MGIALRVDLSKTLPVKPIDLHRAMHAAVALGRDQADAEWLGLFYRAIEALWPVRDDAIRHWARARALAGFLAQPTTLELDRLRRQELELRKANGAAVDIEGTMRMEYCCRLAAAAGHPLSMSGDFAPGFPQTVREILDATLQSLAQQADSN